MYTVRNWNFLVRCCLRPVQQVPGGLVNVTAPMAPTQVRLLDRTLRQTTAYLNDFLDYCVACNSYPIPYLGVGGRVPFVGELFLGFLRCLRSASNAAKPRKQWKTNMDEPGSRTPNGRQRLVAEVGGKTSHRHWSLGRTMK